MKVRSPATFLPHPVLVAILLAAGTACDFKLPDTGSYAHTGEATLPDLPFNYSWITALAWHPDGNRLAVAERAGTEIALTGMTLTERKPHDLGLRFRNFSLRAFASVPARRWVIAASAEGALTAWSIESGQATPYFPGPVQPKLWSVDEHGEQLAYVPVLPSGADSAWQVRVHDFKDGSDALLWTGTAIVREVKILADGSGLLLLLHDTQESQRQSRIYHCALPGGTPILVMASDDQLALMAPARHSARFSVVAWSSTTTRLLIGAPGLGTIDSLALDRPPLSACVWTDQDRKLAMMLPCGSPSVLALQVLDLADHRFTVVAQLSRFSGPYVVELFAIGDTLAYFSPATATVQVFDRRTYAMAPWFQLPSLADTLLGTAWQRDGNALLLHLHDEAGLSHFYRAGAHEVTHFAKPYACTSVSWLPDGRHFLALQDGRIFQDALDAPATDFSFPALQASMARAHPAAPYAFVLERSNDPAFMSARLLRLDTRAYIDSLPVATSTWGELQWNLAKGESAQLSALWARRHRQPGFPEWNFELVTFAPMQIKPVSSSFFSPVFAVFPDGKHLAFFSGPRVLWLAQWRIPVP